MKPVMVCCSMDAVPVSAIAAASDCVACRNTCPARNWYSSEWRIQDAAIKEDVAWGRSVMHKVLDVHAQRFVHELMHNRSRTRVAPPAILDDGARAIADDGVAASLQRQQERGLPCARTAGDDYSRHAELPLPSLTREARAARPRVDSLSAGR